MTPSNELLLQQVREHLEYIRHFRQLSLADVYLATGILANYIEDASGDIDLLLLSRICDYYGVSLSEFFRAIEESLG